MVEFKLSDYLGVRKKDTYCIDSENKLENILTIVQKLPLCQEGDACDNGYLRLEIDRKFRPFVSDNFIDVILNSETFLKMLYRGNHEYLPTFVYKKVRVESEDDDQEENVLCEERGCSKLVWVRESRQGVGFFKTSPSSSTTSMVPEDVQDDFVLLPIPSAYDLACTIPTDDLRESRPRVQEDLLHQREENFVNDDKDGGGDDNVDDNFVEEDDDEDGEGGTVENAEDENIVDGENRVDEGNNSGSSCSAGGVRNILNYCKNILDAYKNCQVEVETSELSALETIEKFHETLRSNQNDIDVHRFVELKKFQWLIDIPEKNIVFHPSHLDTFPSSSTSPAFNFEFSNSLQVPFSMSPFQTTKVILKQQVRDTRPHHHHDHENGLKRKEISRNFCGCNGDLHAWGYTNVADYLIWGAPRIWIVIYDPASIKKLFDYFESHNHIRYNLEDGNGNNGRRVKISRNLFDTSTYVPSLGPSGTDGIQVHIMPALLHKLGIKFKIIVQQPGDLIVLKSGACFQTINTGVNYSTSINTLLLESEFKLTRDLEIYYQQQQQETRQESSTCECMNSLTEEFLKMKRVDDLEGLKKKLEVEQKKIKTQFKELFKGRLKQCNGHFKNSVYRYDLIKEDIDIPVCKNQVQTFQPTASCSNISRSQKKGSNLVTGSNGPTVKTRAASKRRLENNQDVDDGSPCQKISKFASRPVTGASRPVTGTSRPISALNLSCASGSDAVTTIIYGSIPRRPRRRQHQMFELPSSSTENYSSGPPEPKLYKCSYCKMEYKRKDILINHESRHIGKPLSFTCDICGKKYLHKTNLYRHRSKVHKRADNIE